MAKWNVTVESDDARGFLCRDGSGWWEPTGEFRPDITEPRATRLHDNAPATVISGYIILRRVESPMERILRMAEGFRQSDGGFTIASMGKIYAIAREQIGKAQSDATPDPTETEVAWAEVTRVADAILANLVSIRRYYGGEASFGGANAHASALHIIAIANKQLARRPDDGACRGGVRGGIYVE